MKEGGEGIKKSLIYGIYTDKGSKKQVNEDSVLLHYIVTKKGEMLIAGVCDGIGGFYGGEIASGYICEELSTWFYEEGIVILSKYSLERSRRIKKAGFRIVEKINEKIITYQEKVGRPIGSTVTFLVFFRREYYIFHIGDSSGILCAKKTKKLTREHSLNKYTLTKCIGVTKEARPDFVYGRLKRKEGILLCSDGFLGKIKMEEIGKSLFREGIKTKEDIEKCLCEITQRSIQRGETDNISAVFVKKRK